MNEQDRVETGAYRPGLLRPLGTTEPLRNEDVYVDALQVEFASSRVRYRHQADWERWCHLIAPPRSSADYALVRDGNYLHRKQTQRGGWFHRFWYAEIKHWPRDGGGRLLITLNINPTRFEAFRALERPVRNQPQRPLTDEEKAIRLQALTLDQSTNFVPTFYRRYLREQRNWMVLSAIREFQADLIRQLQRARQPVAGPGALGWDEPGFTLNWDDWRVHRLEHYAEVRHPNAVSVVRRGYFDTRARFSEIASDVYADHPDEPRRVMSELDRNRRALSFRIQKSASSSVTVYAKAEDIIRIERRWVRGGAAPEVNFREYQARGIEGLAAWVEAMKPGSRDRIADVESRLSTLAQSGSIDPAQQWAKLCAILSSSFRNRPDQIEAFLEQLILPGGFHRPSASPLVQRAIIDLETAGLFERIDRRECYAPTPPLQAYLFTIREAFEVSSPSLAAELGTADR